MNGINHIQKHLLYNEFDADLCGRNSGFSSLLFHEQDEISVTGSYSVKQMRFVHPDLFCAKETIISTHTYLS